MIRAASARAGKWHETKLLATLEDNRLRNYLAAVDLEDRAAA